MRWHRSSCLASGERSCPRLFSPASESTRDSRLRVRRVVSASRQVSPPHGDLGNRVKDPPTTGSVSGRSGGDGWRRGAARRGGVGGAGGGETERWQNFCPFTVDTLLIGSTLRGLVPRARPLRGNTGGRAFRSSPQIFCRSSTGYEPYVPFARGQLNNWRRPIFPTSLSPSRA